MEAPPFLPSREEVLAHWAGNSRSTVVRKEFRIRTGNVAGVWGAGAALSLEEEAEARSYQS